MASLHESGWDHEKCAVYLWRSGRATGDTKTKKSRRTLKLPRRVWWQCRTSGRVARRRPLRSRCCSPARPAPSGGAMTVPRAFRREVLAPAGLEPGEWTPPRATAQLRVAALGQRDAARPDRAAGQAQRHAGHGEDLLAAGPARDPGRRTGHGSDLPEPRIDTAGTHYSSQARSLRGNGPDLHV